MTPASSARLVFVYGTLRQGDDNDINRQTPPPVFVGTARVAGTLYHLGRYPGLILGGQRQVLGEIYAVSPALERRLDEIEELYPQQSDEYRKVEIDIALADRTLRCFVYEINPRYVQGRPVIESGDWVRDRGLFHG